MSDFRLVSHNITNMPNELYLQGATLRQQSMPIGSTGLNVRTASFRPSGGSGGVTSSISDAVRVTLVQSPGGVAKTSPGGGGTTMTPTNPGGASAGNKLKKLYLQIAPKGSKIVYFAKKNPVFEAKNYRLFFASPKLLFKLYLQIAPKGSKIVYFARKPPF
jgi:hypothetical protein